ncbi:hypothetical protein [Micromonospora sp. C95]|uniref:hypothetical protein n=1 Tax=Micromonospora sp. C95 TaxID=2824882 RepID=UPI0027DB3CF6|nr:hypothetical protein [Micromonospora sp. C95]
MLLLLIAFLALVVSRTFPFTDDLSGLAESAIAVGGAVCGLAGVWLWLRRTPASEAPSTTGEAENR